MWSENVKPLLWQLQQMPVQYDNEVKQKEAGNNLNVSTFYCLSKALVSECLDRNFQ